MNEKPDGSYSSFNSYAARMRQFGGLEVFSKDIEKGVLDFVEMRFDETREKIREFERRARDRGKDR